MVDARDDPSYDGSTSVHNGVLLCRHHHVFLHKRKWYVEFDENGIPQVHRANGDIFMIPPRK